MKYVKTKKNIHFEIKYILVLIRYTLFLCVFFSLLLPLSPLQILERLNKMCSTGVWKKQQRLLKNMGAHKVMLDLLQVSYDKVSLTGTSGFDDGKNKLVAENCQNVFLCVHRMTQRCWRSSGSLTSSCSGSAWETRRTRLCCTRTLACSLPQGCDL